MESVKLPSVRTYRIPECARCGKVVWTRNFAINPRAPASTALSDLISSVRRRIPSRSRALERFRDGSPHPSFPAQHFLSNENSLRVSVSEDFALDSAGIKSGEPRRMDATSAKSRPTLRRPPPGDSSLRFHAAYGYAGCNFLCPHVYWDVHFNISAVFFLALSEL